jgi:hypothetical protein
MSIFTGPELSFLLAERRLARIATVGADGTPHVTPVGWAYNAEHDTIDIGGHHLERSKKYATPSAARALHSSSTTSPALTLGMSAASRCAVKPRFSKSRVH